MEFRPDLLPRRGEWFAWLGAIGLVVGLYITGIKLGELPITYLIFTGLILLFASSISLGNWMDRCSFIRLGMDGIVFENGLRKVSFSWHEIQSIEVHPTWMGKRVQVQGFQSHFTFKTMWQSRLGGKETRTGFPDGQKILETMLRESGLTKRSEKDGRVYYRRP